MLAIRLPRLHAFHYILGAMIFSRGKSSSRVSEILLPGQISYLQKQRECREEDLLRVDIDEGCYDHLVVILSTDTQSAQVEALILTSFGGKSLEERHPYNARVRLYHLPISPSPRHPDNGMLLELEGDLKLPKETYVKIDVPYMIPWSMLRTRYRDLRSGQTLALKPRSFATLLCYLESRLSAQPKFVRKTIASRRATTFRSFRRAQRPSTPKLAPTFLKILALLLTIVLIYMTLSCLRDLYHKITDWANESVMQYLGPWSPLKPVEDV